MNFIYSTPHIILPDKLKWLKVKVVQTVLPTQGHSVSACAILRSLMSVSAGVQGWRSGESTRLPPMWPGFDSRARLHRWVEFVGSLLCTEGFSPGTPVSPLLKNQHLT